MGMSDSQQYRIIKNSDFSDLKSLPADTGGKHLANSLGATAAPYGYYIYLPAGYEQSSGNYPLLVFLHGVGECGNSSEDVGNLDLVLIHGPPHLIHNGRWTPPYPMIVVSPQCHDKDWQPEKVDEFIRYVANNYRMNQSRVYLTGLSMGGDGVYRYLSEMGSRSLVAAAVVICGEGNAAEARNAKVPIWVFHGEFDDVVPLQTAIEMVEGFSNALEARLTVYPNLGHGGWSETYDLSGMGKESEKYDPYDISIYDWLLTFSLSEE
jgi:predicted peptidase